MTLITTLFQPFYATQAADGGRLLFPFIPQSEYVESIEFLTDVIRTKRTEQRISLRRFPRRTYRYSYILSAEEYARARLLSGRSNEPFNVPLWGDTLPAGTLSAGASQSPPYHPARVAQRHFTSGGTVLVWDGWRQYAIRTITAIESGVIYFTALPNNTTFENALLVPVFPGRMVQPLSVTRQAGTDVLGDVTFEVNEDFGNFAHTIPYPNYLDLPVMTSPVSANATLSESSFREVETFDNAVGPVWTAPAFAARSHTSSIVWDFIDRANFWNVYNWLLDQRGRWKGFFIPSNNEDFRLAAPVSFGDTSISVHNTGSARNDFEFPLHLSIETSDGNHVFHTANSFTQGQSGGADALLLDRPYGTVQQPRRISIMFPMRFDADRIEINHTAGGNKRISVPVKNIPLG